MLYSIAKPLLFRLDPEKAHHLGLWAAQRGGAWLGNLLGSKAEIARPVEVAGLQFPNAVGLAAGFDKNGVALPFWRALGFGHVEFGTVTPRPQAGNDKPRVWRFPQQRAVGNRLGFPNAVGLAAGFDKNGVALPFWRALGFGHVEFGTVTPRPQFGNDKPRVFRFPAQRALGNRLGFPNNGAMMVAQRIRRDRERGDVIGINLGKNKDTPNERAVDDYLSALEATRGVADYWVVNVSSPNTPGLRELQSKQYLTDLLSQVREAAGEVPLFVKLSPDLDEAGLQDAAESAKASNCAGVVATNTTLERPDGIEPFEGGLSGAPLAGRSREVLIELRRLLPPGTPLISVGGIDSAEEARARLDAGASLVQIYSAMVFEGPALVGRILRGL